MKWTHRPCGTYTHVHYYVIDLTHQKVITVCGVTHASRFTIPIDIKVLVHFRNLLVEKLYKSLSFVILFNVHMYEFEKIHILKNNLASIAIRDHLAGKQV